MTTQQERLNEIGLFIKASRERSEASRAAYLAGERRYWYYVHTDYCPVCGKDDTARERIYGPRPEAREDRSSFHETYDWCDS